MSEHSHAVEAHYGRTPDILRRVLNVLREEGEDTMRPDPAILTKIDQLHTLGSEATDRLIALAGIEAKDRVLDVGCGLGGPARTLARQVGCQVVGVDLTPVYCMTAAALSRRVAREDDTAFACADALHLPFADASWSVVWSQHTAMNIADKARFYSEIARVLEPGGRFAFFDAVATVTREIHFPVPWASHPEQSFVVPVGLLHRFLSEAGLEECAWHDMTAEVVTRINRRHAKARAVAEAPGDGKTSRFGPGRILGPEFAEMEANLVRNLVEGRLGLLQAVFRKPMK